MSVVTRRYARALADAVFENKLDALKIAATLDDLEALLVSSQELRVVWENPAVSADQKRAVLDAIARKMNLPKLVRNFMAVLIDHRRVSQLVEITREFEAEVNDRMGVAEAEITTARVLATSERKQVEKKIAQVVGKTIKARYNIDANVLGGAVIRVGSTVYDGSVRGQLQRLKEALSTQRSAPVAPAIVSRSKQDSS